MPQPKRITNTSRSGIRSGRARTNTTPNELANELATRLTIAGSKGKEKENVESPVPDQKSRLSAMRAVNAASQALSATIQSGWKCPVSASGRRNDTTLAAVLSSTESAAKNLTLLREICPNDVDVERSAASILGKLVALDLFDEAKIALEHMYPCLCALLGVSETRSVTSLRLISVPRTSSQSSLDAIQSSILSSYLIYALNVMTQSIFSSIPTIQDHLEAFTFALLNEDTLLAWIPSLSSLPTKQLDSILTRTYTILTKACSSSSTSNPKALFSIRMHALNCLAHTSPGVIGTDSLWDQAVRFGSVFVKASVVPQEEMVGLVLKAYVNLVDLVEKRPSSAELMVGRAFIGFCENWMAFARKASDIYILDRIATLMQGKGSASSSKPQLSIHSSVSASAECNGVAAVTIRDSPMRPLDVDIAQVCAILAQATVGLEQKGSELRQRVQDAIDAISGKEDLIVEVLGSEGSSSAEQVQRLRGKVHRGLERMRRTALATLEASSGAEDDKTLVASLLTLVVDILEKSLHKRPDSELMSSAVDTLFALSKIHLVPLDPRTHIPAHDLLSRAVSLTKIAPSDFKPSLNVPNCVRCISGAFYNMGGTLYQSGKHGAAIAFLKEACALGQGALNMRPTAPVLEPKASERTEEGWRQLEDQLFRRWELLGVCYSKIGDRKNAYEAFVEAIKAFPYLKQGFADLASRLTLKDLFGVSSAMKQLASIVDRATYLAASELLLDSASISLCLVVPESAVAGALVERQVDSLKGSLWKEGIQRTVACLLKDTLELYADDMPVRRSRVLLRVFDFAYHTNSDLSKAPLPNDWEDTCKRTIQLLGLGAFAQDAELAPYVDQYLASMHFWIVLRAFQHPHVTPSISVTEQIEEACRILKCPNVGNAKASKKSMTPRKGKIPIAVGRKASAAIQGRLGHSKRPAKKAETRAPVTPKPKTRKALQPVSLNVASPPRFAESEKALKFDEFEKLVELMQLTARTMGLLSLAVPKLRILDNLRKLCERELDNSSDSYILATVDLAYEYVKLGKYKRAAGLFNQALNSVRSGRVSDEACSSFLLRFAESLAVAEDFQASLQNYLEALSLSERLADEDKSASTLRRIQSRVQRLERAALASNIVALIQHHKEDVAASLTGMLRSLRLWNRAFDTLARLNAPPAPSKTEDDNPFQMAALKEALPTVSSEGSFKHLTGKSSPSLRIGNSLLGLRISEGLLSTLFALSDTYLLRGSVREAEYFAQQAQELAQSSGMPHLLARALTLKAEIQLYRGQLEECRENMAKALGIFKRADPVTIENVNLHRLQGIYNERAGMWEDAQGTYESGLGSIEDLNQAFGDFDGIVLSRKSLGVSPNKVSSTDSVFPEAFAALLRRHIWLLRDRRKEDYTNLLNKLFSLQQSSRTKAEENALVGKLTLHTVYGNLQTDMFLSSLAESTIAVPMGMSNKTDLPAPLPVQGVLSTLDDAENLFWMNLGLTSKWGKAIDVRDTAMSLALIRALQTSLGSKDNEGPALAANLLNISVATTLRREMLEAIENKFPSPPTDDARWPSIDTTGRVLPPAVKKPLKCFSLEETSESEDEEELVEDSTTCLKEYWASVKARYQAQDLTPNGLSSSGLNQVPPNWTIVHMNVTEDKSALFIARQDGGGSHSPLMFCIPLKGRRDNGAGDDDEERLTFQDALNDFQEIVRLSDEGTRGAIHVRKDDPAARAAWWKQRAELDKRLRNLLENIEFCWLGAFKTILSPRPNLSSEMISDLRVSFERVFQRSLNVQDKTRPRSRSIHKKTASQSPAPSQVTFDDALLECFSTLSPKCKDEELEDLVYFILDLYQFHGVPVAISEVDITQVVVDLRGVLEEHSMRLAGKNRPLAKPEQRSDEHVFLVLDKNLQGLPWESIPILRGRSVSRIPSVEFLIDRLEFAQWRKTRTVSPVTSELGRAIVDPRRGYYVLNPSGDLKRTEERFKGWSSHMEGVGWKGITGRPPTEQEFADALRRHDLVVYFGHGGGEQYIRSHRIRNLPSCAATMLWGCSSGALKEMGDFDRIGTPFNYMLAGCPTLVANLWDVTDRDIDKFSQSVFDKLRLDEDGIRKWDRRDSNERVSIVEAVGKSRDSCKLKYLTGAAPVVYGIPFYL